jgi:RNA polymerase sigma factor (sigma-70 family)
LIVFVNTSTQLEKVEMSLTAASPKSQSTAGIEEIADLYAAHAVRIRRLVHLDVQAPDHVVEEACQVAWTRLVTHRERVRRECAVRWLVRVARHEAWRQLDRQRRVQSLDELHEQARQALHDAEAPPRPLPTTPDLMDELVAQRARLDAIDDLPDRQRRLLWLQGLGFSYEEMAGETGDSHRTIERQLERARRSLHLHAA